MSYRHLVIGIVGIVAWFGAFSTPVAADTWPTYAQIGTTLQAYETTYPSICKRYSLGQSVQGRELWAIRISDNVLVEEDEPEVKYIASMHGTEVVGCKMCMMFVDYLLTNYGTVPRVTNMVDSMDIWIVPLMNPDGYEVVYPETSRTYENANGINLNRNFPEGTNGDPNTTTGRQPETAAVMNWSFGRSFTLAANLHGGALVANYPFDCDGLGSVNSPTPDDDMFRWISEEYSSHNLPMYNGAWYHGITNGAAWYEVEGGMQDWDYRYMGGNEITIELGNVKEPSTTQIPTLWNDNRESMLAYLETSLVGVRGIVTDGASGLPLAATITVVGRNHNVYTDPDVGDYHRMLRPGTYSLTFTASGYDSYTATNVVVTSGAATRLDVQLWGPPAVVYPNGGETLYAGTPATVTWAGKPSDQYHVQYTGDYGAADTVTDDFERASIGSDYATGGDNGWVITSTTYHSATRSARAGVIGHSQSSWMTRTAYSGPLRFYYRVSSQTSYDWFNFYVDGVRKINSSGIVAWQMYSTTLAAGSHELKWEYVKNASGIGGADTVWIDDLTANMDATTWTDIVALTDPGVLSTSWTPPQAGTAHKVRVRPYDGSTYGEWDESDAVFTVADPPGTGDYDGDGDVDLADFAGFQLCYDGAAAAPCDAFEFVVNGLIDLTDFAALEPLLAGPQ